MPKWLSDLAQGAKRLLPGKAAASDSTTGGVRETHDNPIVTQTAERDTAIMRQFHTEVVGDLHEPRLQLELIVPAWLTTLGGPTVLIIMHHYLWAIAAFVALGFLWGIRFVPTVHNALLYVFGRRYDVGFWEGPIWIPWMVAKLKILNIERFSYKIPKEDCWTTDQMHVVYSIIIRFGVRPVAEKSVLTNFFWFFHWLFKSDTYYDFVEAGLELGAGLNNFMLNADVMTALTTGEAHAQQATRQRIRALSIGELFSFTGSAYLADAKKISQTAVRLEEDILPTLNQLIINVGIEVSNLSIADLDFHESAAQIFEQKLLASVLAEAEKLAYKQRIKIAEKLMLDPQVGEAALKVEIVRALNAAASQGLLGPLLTGTALEKVMAMSGLPNRLVTS